MIKNEFRYVDCISPTQHKRFALLAHPNPDFVGTSFMLETLGETVALKILKQIS